MSGFAGITVPDGEPGALQDVAARLEGMASAASGLAQQVGALPSSMSWSGPASVSYAGSCLTNTSAASGCAASIEAAAGAVRTYARELREDKQDAREAIRDAKDAQDRIDEAERQIEAARDRQQAAAARYLIAEAAVLTTSLTGTPSASAEAERAQAGRDRVEAAEDERRWTHRRDAAQDDLRAAQRRGERAEQDAKRAGATAAGALDGAATPVAAAAYGAPAPGIGGVGALPFVPVAVQPGRGIGSTPFAPSTSPTGGDGFGLPDVSLGFGAAGGAMIGIGMGFDRQAQFARRYHANALARLGSPAYDSLRSLPERAAIGPVRAAHAQGLQDAKRGSGISKGTRVGGRLLGAGGVVLTAKANADEGMSTTENAIRTGASATGAAVVGGAAATACSLLGPVAAACGAGGGVVGSIGGDVVGGVAYDGLDAGYNHVIKPLGKWIEADDREMAQPLPLGP